MFVEPLDFEFKYKTIKSLDIIYKKEVQYGNKILSKAKIEGNTTTHMIINSSTGEDLCNIRRKLDFGSRF